MNNFLTGERSFLCRITFGPQPLSLLFSPINSDRRPRCVPTYFNKEYWCPAVLTYDPRCYCTTCSRHILIKNIGIPTGIAPLRISMSAGPGWVSIGIALVCISMGDTSIWRRFRAISTYMASNEWMESKAKATRFFPSSPTCICAAFRLEIFATLSRPEN